MEPTFRCGTRKAMDELSIELGIPLDSGMQDWSYTEGNPDDMEQYLAHYRSLNDEDKKFVLMEFMIQATEDQKTEARFLHYCKEIQPLLQADFKLHEYTIHYWCCFELENLEDAWKITPFMRAIWDENQKLKILFVCTVNRMRSATAHQVFQDDPRFEVRSAGTDPSANTVLSIELLDWADSIVVMETHHRNTIRKHFPAVYQNKRIVCLYIPDEYDYMDAGLIELLKHKVTDVYTKKLI